MITIHHTWLTICGYGERDRKARDNNIHHTWLTIYGYGARGRKVRDISASLVFVVTEGHIEVGTKWIATPASLPTSAVLTMYILYKHPLSSSSAVGWTKVHSNDALQLRWKQPSALTAMITFFFFQFRDTIESCIRPCCSCCRIAPQV